MTPIFIQINGGLFNVNKIQAIDIENKLNNFGKEAGEYYLHVCMENNIGSTRIAFSDKEKRNNEFKKILDKLREFGISNAGQKEEV